MNDKECGGWILKNELWRMNDEWWILKECKGRILKNEWGMVKDKWGMLKDEWGMIKIWRMKIEERMMNA